LLKIESATTVTAWAVGNELRTALSTGVDNWIFYRHEGMLGHKASMSINFCCIVSGFEVAELM
jgi:hypothetical protein